MRNQSAICLLASTGVTQLFITLLTSELIYINISRRVDRTLCKTFVTCLSSEVRLVHL